MSHSITRRKLLADTGRVALVAALGSSCASGLSIFGVFPKIGGDLLSSAANALNTGWNVINIAGNVANLIKDADDLAQQTKAVEDHINSVLSQVTTTLQLVQSFVQDCDNALHDIENLVKDLPSAIDAAFQHNAAVDAFKRIRGDCTALAALLGSTDYMIQESKSIEKFWLRVAGDIAGLDAVQHNDFQFVMQAVPALTTWMQGYTVYNLTANSRGPSPWKQPVVKDVVLPRLQTFIKSVKKQQSTVGDISSHLPLEAGSIYTFDGTTFVKSKRPFSLDYSADQIDSDFYYTIYPNNKSIPPGAYCCPAPGDFSYLGPVINGLRFWYTAQKTLTNIGPPGKATDNAQTAAAAYPRLLTTSLKSAVALNQLSPGLEVFDGAVQSRLANDCDDIWEKLPTLQAHPEEWKKFQTLQFQCSQ